MAAELTGDQERVHERKNAADKKLRDLVQATDSSLAQLNGIGPSGAARLLVEVADISRLPSRAHLAPQRLLQSGGSAARG